MTLYTDNDPKVCQWLQNLIGAGLLDGEVLQRSIRDIESHELRGYSRVHLFAGIGGWELALRYAGWPDDVPVWTGSCPCQPFSTAGKRRGSSDDRHLWPAMFNLIRECRPQYVFGEQVASAIGHGWLDGVSSDLEAEGYTVGATVLGAHSVGAPHIRQRLYWVAYAEHGRPALQEQGPQPGPQGDGTAERVGHAGSERWQGCDETRTETRPAIGDAMPWSDYRIVQCRDGRSRRISTEPGAFPLADGVPARVVKLRAYGNAIVPQVAAVFVRAFMESL